MAVLSTIFDALLVGTSAYAMYKITPAAPYAFASAALSCLCGVIGFVENLSETFGMLVMHDVTSVVVQALHYPLLNIQFYMDAKNANPWVLAHGFAMVPYISGFIYYWAARKGDDEMAGEYMTALAELCFYGNTVALLHLAFNEKNNLYFMLAVTYFLHTYCRSLSRRYLNNIHNCFLSVISLLVSQTHYAK